MVTVTVRGNDPRWRVQGLRFLGVLERLQVGSNGGIGDFLGFGVWFSGMMGSFTLSWA